MRTIATTGMLVIASVGLSLAAIPAADATPSGTCYGSAFWHSDSSYNSGWWHMHSCTGWSIYGAKLCGGGTYNFHTGSCGRYANGNAAVECGVYHGHAHCLGNDLGDAGMNPADDYLLYCSTRDQSTECTVYPYPGLPLLQTPMTIKTPLGVPYVLP